MSVARVCRDVKDFLRTLAGDLPEVFPQPRLYYRRVRRARAPGPTPAQKRRARELINSRVAHWAAALGLEYKKIFIKNQRSMWASCSARGNLNFNWRLAAAPPEALDYVVIHELCHLREMNHSRAFWAHVLAACPDYKAHRRWLRNNTDLLRRTDILD
ncbi:MAG: M48 family metallopeptidase [Elusimicrobia bacterium]|nr:M48 family metallopeptidase [Elusimicrobiota bacterium]